MMAGLKVDLTKMNGAGSGQLTLDLGRLMPSMATVESHSELSMAMNLGTQKQTMGMKLDLNMRLEGQ